MSKAFKIDMEPTLCYLFDVILAACNFSFSENEPDVSQIQANIKLVRFEKELFNLDSQNLNAGLQSLIQNILHFQIYILYN